MRHAALASGSKGNCHAFCDGERTLLVDAGISLRRIRESLGGLGWDPGQIRAVALTHEHSDHIGAVEVLLRNTEWAFLATLETKRAVESLFKKEKEIPSSRWIQVRPGHPYDWAGWRILPFSLPHDAEDPVAFRVEAMGSAAAVVTDLGHATALVADHVQDLDLLVLEANHDIDMLREGSYPPHLKARILSRVGHLSNAAMAELLDKALGARLKSVVLAHLSEQNNDPALARLAAEDVLGSRTGIDLRLATQREPISLRFAS
jgi:phosphoribosyl 1,2-cyclic phosphodiesterase